MTSDREERIRLRALRIWEEEGRPEGRADIRRHMATELIAIEDNQLLTLKPVEDTTSLSPSRLITSASRPETTA